jgi:transcriptional regulator with XRE-family HTH domain
MQDERNIGDAVRQAFLGRCPVRHLDGESFIEDNVYGDVREETGGSSFFAALSRPGQANLASLSGVAQPNLSKIERGQTPATLETYLRILGALGIDLHGVIRQ